MRIGIDYTSAVRQRAGIGRYTRNLIRELAKIDTHTPYTLFVAGGWGDGDGLGPWPPNFRIRSIALSDRWMNVVWQRLRLPLPVQTLIGQVDGFHSPDFVLPPTGRAPALLTVHDLSFLRVPHCFVPGFAAYLRGAVGRAVGRAQHILADSESTRRDLVVLMGVEPSRISVLYPGVEARFQPVRDELELRRVRVRYNLPELFVLGLGTLQPRKNFPALAEAFQRVAAQRGSCPWLGDLHLVIAGGRGWLHEEVLRQVHAQGLGERLHLVGYVDDVDLPALYSLASVFAFPSLYEGFGLPVLEAMACGTPVVAASNSSLPEVVGDAGLLAEAGDVGALASGLTRLLLDQQLRLSLREKGMVQAQRFTWAAAALHLRERYAVLVDRKVGLRVG